MPDIRNALGLSLLLFGLGLTGCAVGPDYQRPELALPEEWPEGVTTAMSDSEEAQATWWERYEDPVLDRLVRSALENNLDVELAVARVAEARATLGLSRAERFPTLDADLYVEREDEGAQSAGDPANVFELRGVLNYELDLWGRLERETESARASLLASAFTRDAAEIAVVSDVVTTYFDYRAAMDQIETTENTIASREEALEFQETRQRIGASTKLDLRQAEAELETSRAELPGLEADAARLTRALAILIGDEESVLNGLKDLGSKGLPNRQTITDLPESMPSSLIERRPDIRAAEAILIAANADIGAARANWFPRINLMSAFGTGATDASDLFTGPAVFWELIGTATAPILDFGRRSAQVDTVEAQREIAELEYRATVRTAFQEVGDAWTLLRTAEERLHARDREVVSRIKVVALAERRYNAGYSSYLELLDARRALFEAQLSRTNAARDSMVAVANLYRALGGGWQAGEAKQSSAAD